MEGLRFQYFDSQRNEWRTALPDFYLPEQDKIIEIKSNYTLDEQNMRDKERAYRECGYDFDLIVDNVRNNDYI